MSISVTGILTGGAGSDDRDIDGNASAREDVGLEGGSLEG